MAYGKLSDAQRDALRPHVSGLKVHDLGAGTCELSRELLDLGATSVVAIDTQDMPFVDRRIERVQDPFQLYRDPISVAFVSWPINREDRGLMRLVREAKKVVYLGKNTDGVMCGWPGLFNELVKRKVLAYIPERKNTLIVYGGQSHSKRKFLGEEHAGATALVTSEWMSFEEVEGLPEDGRSG